MTVWVGASVTALASRGLPALFEQSTLCSSCQLGKVLFGKILGGNLWTEKQVVSFLCPYLPGSLPNFSECVRALAGHLAEPQELMASRCQDRTLLDLLQGFSDSVNKFGPKATWFFALGSAALLSSCSPPPFCLLPSCQGRRSC